MTSHERRGQLSITIQWQGETIAHRLVDPGGDFVVGASEEADFTMPEALVGNQLHRIAVLDEEGRAEIRWSGESVRLELDEAVTLDLDEITIEIGYECSEPRVLRRSPLVMRHLASQALSALAICASLVVSAHCVPSAAELADEEDERRLLMQRYLLSAEEQELEALESAMNKSSTPQEGGTGTRAKGAEGTMGASPSWTPSRYGVAGPGDPHLQRAAALKDAAEFGMLGLMKSGAGLPARGVGIGTGAGHGHGAGGFGLSGVGEPARSEPTGIHFADYGVNDFVRPGEDPVSTFAIDVDTGSFPIVRKNLNGGHLVNRAAVRPEEIINYFDYGYPGPAGDEPFTAHVHAAPSPFDAGHHILRVGIQARRAPRDVPAHLVYLVDTSGSMQSPDKMGLVKESLRMLTGTLKPGDTVALCTYAGSVREVLAPTGIEDRWRILSAIDQLTAAGSTAMASGIELAYGLAERRLVKGHINRVIVLSDGDANVGATSHEEILAQIDGQRKKGITLSTIGFGTSNGFGTGNYNDVMMERLADEGDGNYQYVDDLREAKRVFVDHADSMLEVVAKDVKIQVELDPRAVQTYRLIGYENRDVADEDFRDDAVDGGEVGAGHNVTAIYDVVLKPHRLASAKGSWVTVRVRHKAPDGDRASEQAFPLAEQNVYARFDEADAAFRFATAAAGFAELLRQSPHASGWSLPAVARIADGASEGDEHRAQLGLLARRAQGLGAS